MKIIALLASKRKLGNSHVLLLEAVEAARKQGAEVEIININDWNINICRGDLACVYAGQCSTKDDMQHLIAKLIEADGLIIAAPTYVFGPSGIIKTIADRSLMLFPYMHKLRDKVRKAVTISTAGNQEWNPTGTEGLNHLAWTLGFEVVDYIKAYSPGPAGVLLDDRNVENAALLGMNLANAIEKDLPPRKPQANQCPICFSQSWRWREDDKLECPYCLLPATATYENDRIRITPDLNAGSKSFWDLQRRQEHIENWIIPSKERYLKQRKIIKTKLAKYRKS